MRVTWLADVLRAAGLEVIEHAGWTTHDTGNTWSPEFGVVHATAAPHRQADSVQVDVVRNGRLGLTGPIANCVVTRDGAWHVVSAGRCNTTLVGTAGPYKDMGNTYALGVEGCNDNQDEPWPVDQYRAYVRGWAAICRRLGWTANQLVGHKEHTPGHKTDPTFDMDRFRADVSAVLAGEDDGMADMTQATFNARLLGALKDPAIAERLQTLPWQYDGRGLPPGETSTLSTVKNISINAERAANQGSDPAETARLVLAGLPLPALADLIAARVNDDDTDETAEAFLAKLAARLAV